MTDHDALIGKQFGPYEITDVIGTGGMATVYRGMDLNLQRPVAIKVLSRITAEQPGFTDRFRQEARLIARLRHPNILQVYSLDEQDGITYIAEELLPGPTLGGRLRQLLAEESLMPRAEVLAIIRDLASALDAAHAEGVIHRDVKPDNAIWNASGSLVLTDFGIARQAFSQTQYTQTGTILGTPEYMSPEQAQGLNLTHVSDIYSLGVVLYKLLTGDVPFTGDTAMSVIIAHIQNPPPRLNDRRPDLPPAVDQVVQRALAKNPDARFQSAGEMAEALERAWSGKSVAMGPPPNIHEQQTEIWQSAPHQAQPAQRQPQQRPAPEPAEPSTSRPRTAEAPPRRSTAPTTGAAERGGIPSVPLIIGALLLVALLAGGVFAMGGFGGGEASEATATPIAAAETSTASATPTATGEPNATPTATGEPSATPTATGEPSATPTEEAAAVVPPLPPVFQLAFASDRDGPWNIYRTASDGTNVQQITDSAGDDYAPSWSPNGTQIAFHTNRAGNEDIYLISTDANYSQQQQLTTNDYNEREPVWSPDGSRIAYWANPSGDNANWDVFVMNADGSNQRRITSSLGGDFQPTWSPDGQTIAFTSNRNGTDDIFLINADGSNERQITEHPGNERLASWSPDGTQLAFASDRDGNLEIYALTLQTGELRNLTNQSGEDTQPAWSPDGQTIAFTADRDGNNEIYVMNADGSNPRRVTENPTRDWDASWSP